MNATSREKTKRSNNNSVKLLNKNGKANKNLRGRTPEHSKFNRIYIPNKQSNNKILRNGQNNIKTTDHKKYRTKSDLINGKYDSALYYPTQTTSTELLTKRKDNVNNKLLYSATKKKNNKQSADDLHRATYTKNSYINIFSNNHSTKNNSTQKKNFNRIKTKVENNKTKLKHNNYTHINITNKSIKCNKQNDKISSSCRTSFKKRTETKPYTDRNEKIVMTPRKKKQNLYKTQILENYNKYNNNNYNEKKTKKKFIDKSRSMKKNCMMVRNDDLEKKNNTINQVLNYEENINTEKETSIKNNNQDNLTENPDDIKLTESEKPKLTNNSQKDLFTNNNIDEDIDNKNENTKTNLRLYNQMANSLTSKTKTTERKQSAHNNSVVERIIFTKNITKLLTSANKIYKGKKIENIGIISVPGETDPGVKKTNQDNYFNYDLCNDYKFIGVCDGHGEDGHFISEFIKNTLPDELNHLLEKLIEEEKENLGISNENEIKDDIELRKKIEKIDKIKDIMTDAFKNTNLFAIEECAEFNLEYSGSTCVSIFLHTKKANKLFISNIGDSRAIIIKKKNDEYFPHQLSRDHKPTEEDEAKRIIENGGEIQQIEDENGNWTGPLRIWQKGENGPGLAMTRSFCDVIASTLGVICEPEVFEYKLREEDKVVIVASDGLFEYVTNEEVAKMVGKMIENNDSEDKIVEELYKESNERWKNKESGIDDITIICVMLKNS